MSESSLYNHCGDDSVEDPPVLIPNTEVKLNCAESTWLATAREDKELPHSIFLVSSAVERPYRFNSEKRAAKVQVFKRIQGADDT